MIERGGSARFLLETLEAVAVPGEGRREHLDGDVASEPRVARTVHLAHRSCSDQGDYLVGAEPGAWSESHGL